MHPRPDFFPLFLLLDLTISFIQSCRHSQPLVLITGEIVLQQTCNLIGVAAENAFAQIVVIYWLFLLLLSYFNETQILLCNFRPLVVLNVKIIIS